MVVYDVIETVSPVAASQSSRIAGVYWVDSADTEFEAKAKADTYNHHAFSGISYHVQEIDECSSDRVPSERVLRTAPAT